MITEFREYLKPEKVYIPLTDNKYKLANVKVEEDQEVKIGDVLAYKFKGKEKLPVLASVSGTVVGFEMLEDRYGKKVDHCVIKNNHKEEQIEVAKYEDPKSSEIRRVILESGLTNVSVDGSFTDLRFDTELNHVVVNAIFVNEPYYTVDYQFVLENAEKIATGIQFLALAAVTDSITVLVDKRMPSEALEAFGKATVDKNIKLISVDPQKLKGQDIKVIQKLVKADLNTNLLASGVLYTDINAANLVYEAVAGGVIPSSRPVVITGDGIKTNAIYEAKFGTKLSDLVKDMEGYNDCDELVLHVGDFLTGTQVTDDAMVVTVTVDAINIAEYRVTEEDVCTKCGDCNDVCPVGILPQNIMDAELRNVSSRIVELDTGLCTECGLCSFVCPSNINVLEWVRRAKRRVG